MPLLRHRPVQDCSRDTTLELRVIHDDRRFALQGSGESDQIFNGDVLLPALDQSDVVTMDIGNFRELFLG